jgi:hypothetical protein
MASNPDPRLGQPAVTGSDAPSKYPAEAKPNQPPGIVVFQPAKTPKAGPVSYPRFIRQLSPNEAMLVPPDPVTGRWPRLHPGAVAEPVRVRRTIDWANRQPSKSAFRDWLRDSEPDVET